MKIQYYIILVLEMICFLIKQGANYFLWIISWIWQKLHALRKADELQILQSLRKKQESKAKEANEKVVVQHITMQINTNGIVGKTNTQFLKESDLPQFSKNKPFQSEDLETETRNEAEEEPDIDPTDVETSTSNEDLRQLLEDENENSDLYDADAPPMDDLTMASGITVEELSATFNTLKKDECSDDEKEKTKQILKRVEGTDFLKFFLLQNECLARAKIFMQEIDAEQEEDNSTQTNGFDVGKYI